MPDEVEGKLIVTAADADAVCEAIARCDAVAGCRVARREVEQIEDAYFDGPSRPLFAAGLALRVRSLNGREVLTIKGASRVYEGVVSREELEVEWSPDGLDEVLEALSQAGVALGDVEAALDRPTAREAIEALGFEATAPRANRRVALTLMRGGDVMAEIDVDAVTFSAGERSIRHYELECEAKGSGNADIVRGVLADLRSQHPGLQAWNVSKLALGALAQQGRLDALIDGDRLRVEAYDLIEAAAS